MRDQLDYEIGCKLGLHRRALTARFVIEKNEDGRPVGIEDRAKPAARLE